MDTDRTAAAATQSAPESSTKAAFDVEELARLSPLEYERVRHAAAEQLRVRVAVLDEEIKYRRKRGNTEPAAGQAPLFPEITPWGEPVDGAAVLDELRSVFSRYLALPSYASVALPLWTMHTHCFDVFTHTPRLNVYSPEKGCGKTLVLDILQGLTPRALRMDNVTSAVLFRLIEARQPTLLVDEHDTFLKNNERLRGILNSGHRRGGVVGRCDGDKHDVRTFRTFAPVALAGIGHLPGTIADRSIAVRMRRALPGEINERFDSRKTEALSELQSKLARWGDDHRAALTECDPRMPEGFNNRQVDNWFPLLAIADAAGGEWPRLAREAAAGLAANDSDNSSSLGVLLLRDCWGIFGGRSKGTMFSKDLLTALLALEESPWTEYQYGKPLTVNQLSRRLRGYGIRSQTVRDGDQTAKGFKREDFEDAWSRYLPPSEASQRHNDVVAPVLPADAAVTATPCDGATTRAKTPEDADCDAVTAAHRGIHGDPETKMPERQTGHQWGYRLTLSRGDAKAPGNTGN